MIIDQRAKLTNAYLQLNDNVGALFRAGTLRVAASAWISPTMNCDVPYLAAYSGNQKLASARDGNAKDVPEGQVRFQTLEFGLFQGDFPLKLKLHLRDKDGVPVFLEKLVIKKVLYAHTVYRQYETPDGLTVY